LIFNYLQKYLQKYNCEDHKVVGLTMSVLFIITNVLSSAACSPGLQVVARILHLVEYFCSV